MGAQRIVIVRHGETDFNVEHRFQGALDKELNAKGRAQAALAAEYLPAWIRERLGSVTFSETQKELGAIYFLTSPLQRASETADIIRDALTGLGMTLGDITVDAGILERNYGVMEGLTLAEAKERYAEWFAQWRMTGECDAAKIERSNVVGQRFADTVTSAAARLADQDILVVVSHGGAISRGIITMLGLKPEEFDGLRGLDNCHWSELVYVGGGGTGATGDPSWRLASHNVGAPV